MFIFYIFIVFLFYMYRSFCRREQLQQSESNRSSDIFSISDEIAALRAVDKPPSYEEVLQIERTVFFFLNLFFKCCLLTRIFFFFLFHCLSEFEIIAHLKNVNVCDL